MKRWIFVLAALALPAFAQAQVHTLPDAPHLLVKGHAEGQYVPDRFTVDMQITVTDPLPGKARAEVEKHVLALFKSIDAHGAIKRLTRASSLSMSEATSYKDGEQVHKGTEVDRHVSVTFDSLKKLQGFISDLPASKEVLVQATTVSRSDQAQLMMKLRTRAITNLKVAAHALAKAYGMQITGVCSISEVAPDFSYGIQAGSWDAGQTVINGNAPPPPVGRGTSLASVDVRAVPTALRTGTIELSQDMYAVYLIAPKR